MSDPLARGPRPLGPDVDPEERTRLLVAALDGVDVGLAVLDADGGIVLANACFSALLLRFPCLLAADHRSARQPVAQRDATGAQVWLEVVVRDLDGTGRRLVTVRDVTAEHEGLRRQRASEERFRRCFESSPTGMALLAGDGRVLVANDALGRLLGQRAAVLVGQVFDDLVPPERSSTAEPCAAEDRRFVRPDGVARWGSVSFAVVEEDDGEDLLLLQVEDVHERRAAQASLAHQALHDPLTGLANRRLVVEEISHALRALGREPLAHTSQVGVLFLDLDGFKEVNDTYGHRAGDALLCEVAARLEHVVRGSDRVARLGGDEFLVLAVAPVSEDALRALAERAQAAVAAPVTWQQHALRVTASIGLACGRAGEDAELLVTRADLAMYRAKRLGKGRCEVFGDALLEEAAGKVRAEVVLERALRDERLQVEYQPVVDPVTGQARSAEALVRLRDADGGLVAPEGFLGVAEHSGLLVALGEQVLDLALAQAATWLRAGTPLRVSVNVAAAQLRRPDLAAGVVSALSAHGVPPSLLELEVVESVLLEAGPAALDQLDALCDAGVRLAVDGFGTGSGSLTVLHALPVATVKVDRSLVAGLPDDRRAAAVVRAVAGLALELDLELVAEGVERPDQRAWLASAVPQALLQGFLSGRPGSPDDVHPPRGAVPAPRTTGRAPVKAR